MERDLSATTASSVRLGLSLTETLCTFGLLKEKRRLEIDLMKQSKGKGHSNEEKTQIVILQFKTMTIE